ncbi:IS3 family transposase [Orbus sasakiae]
MDLSTQTRKYGKAKSMILWYIEVYYNRVRKHSYLNYLSPVQFEEKRI